MANMFLSLTNILGESLDHAHANEIEVHDWGWHLENHAPYRLSEKEATAQTQVNHITIDKAVDAATTTLTGYCAHGKHIPKGILTFRKNAGDSQAEYLKIILTDVKIEKVLWDAKGEWGIKETVDLSFLKFRMSYSVQQAGGELGGVSEFEFDIPEQKAQPAQPGKK